MSMGKISSKKSVLIFMKDFFSNKNVPQLLLMDFLWDILFQLVRGDFFN